MENRLWSPATRRTMLRTISRAISRPVEAPSMNAEGDKVRPQTWLIYALGGGFGHLTRACSLARAAPSPTRVTVLTNSPYARCVIRAMPWLDVVMLDPALGIDEARAEVVRRIVEANPDVLVVDTFPRGLLGELVHLKSLPGRKVLVRRDLNPEYEVRYRIEEFAANYDLVLQPGEGNGVGISTAPWVVRSHDELPDRRSASAILRAEREAPCILICAGGNAPELAWYGAVAAELPCEVVRCVAPHCPEGCPAECWISYWPAMDLYSGACVVIGGGGYNTVYETAACGIPLVSRPWPRVYDRQEVRALQAARIVTEPRQAAESALRLATGVKRQARIAYENGAGPAASLILREFAH